MEEVLVFTVVLLSFFGFIVFILLFGQSPSLRHGPIGSLNVVLTEKLPSAISKVLLFTLGQHNVRRISKAWHYCCESRNPFLQIFFIGLSGASIASFLYYALPHMPGPYLHRIHYVIIPIQIVSIYTIYYIACTADPGIITEKNLKKHLDYYPYDGLLYKPKTCVTCQLEKPARSKHCSMCKACIGKMDHHCAWLNKCVGENNMRYFFYFLFMLVEFCAYGAYLAFQVYRGMIIEWGLDKAYMHDTRTGKRIPITFKRAFLYVLHRDRIIGAVGILAAVVSFVVFIFAVYQLYLASRGITTNEAFKWEAVEDAAYRGEIFKVVKESTSESSAVRFTSKEPKKERRVRVNFEEIENKYDFGVVGNLKEIFAPPKLL
ncbi:zf-DHHC-domain-containing protein [Backusella circina FSU 941]|nr:zf-DHHC-domain-containing protein [Backusella circina FSU 941]